MAVIVHLSFIELLFIVLLGWILVNLWQRYIDNLTYTTMGLNKTSAYHSFVIAAVLTVVFLLLIFGTVVGRRMEDSHIINDMSITNDEEDGDH